MEHVSEIELYRQLIAAHTELDRLRSEIFATMHAIKTQPLSKDIWSDILRATEAKSKERCPTPEHLKDRLYAQKTEGV